MLLLSLSTELKMLHNSPVIFLRIPLELYIPNLSLFKYTCLELYSLELAL